MSTIEKDYYENEAFWDGALFTKDDHERVAVVAARVPTVSSVLDVGCGNGFFLDTLGRLRPDVGVLHGTDRSEAALRRVSVGKTPGSIDALPFPSAAFDCVTCLEVIEHLPAAVYARALPELARVARRYIMVSVPREQDLTLGQVECPECATRFNPDYHFRSFGQRELYGLFSQLGYRCLGVEPYGNSREFLFARTLARLKRDRRNRFPVDILCVACGAVLPGLGRSSTATQATTPVLTRPGVGTRAKLLAKAVWPKRQETRWLLALYEREHEREPRSSPPSAESTR